MASSNNQSAFSHVFNLFIIESAFCSVLIVFARISLSITESLWNNYRKHSLFSWFGINVLMFVFQFHPGTPVIFVFNCFLFIIFFHILPSFIPPHLRLVFIRVLLRLSKYTLYSTRIRNSVSGRKLNTIRLLISVILQDFND